MHLPKDINEYLRACAPELGERILQTYPPLHGIDDIASPLIGQLLRKPFPAQTLAMMGAVKRWNEVRGAAVIAECGTGKTLISLGAVHVHSDRHPFAVLAMVPPQLVEKWAREAFLTLPRVRVFFIDGLTDADEFCEPCRGQRSQITARANHSRRVAHHPYRVATEEAGSYRTPPLGFHLPSPGPIYRGARSRETQLLLAARARARTLRPVSRERLEC
jgi:hypothetical protein